MKKSSHFLIPWWLVVITLLMILPLGLILLTAKLILEKDKRWVNARPLLILAAVFLLFALSYVAQFVRGTMPVDVGGSQVLSFAMRLLLYGGCAAVFLTLGLIFLKTPRPDESILPEEKQK